MGREVNDHESRIRELEIAHAKSEVVITNLSDTIKELTVAVNSLNTYVSAAKGSWKIILAVGAAIAGFIEAVRAVWPNQ